MSTMALTGSGQACVLGRRRPGNHQVGPPRPVPARRSVQRRHADRPPSRLELRRLVYGPTNTNTNTNTVGRVLIQTYSRWRPSSVCGHPAARAGTAVPAGPSCAAVGIRGCCPSCDTSRQVVVAVTEPPAHVSNLATYPAAIRPAPSWWLSVLGRLGRDIDASALGECGDRSR